MKKTAILLLIATLTTAFASCGGGAVDSTTTETTSAAAVSETTAVETTEGRLPLGLPDTDLGGYTLTFFDRERELFHENGDYAETLNGDIINDTVYERNKRVEEKYNCVLAYKETPNDDISSKLTTAILANEDLYSVAYNGAISHSQLAIKDMLYDLNSLENLDFTQPWWSSSINEQVSVAGKTYIAVGAFMLNAKVNIYNLLFNKRIADDYSISATDLYNEVYNDTWTLDKYTAVIKDVKNDLNGDGKYDTNDLWACGSEAYTAYTMMLGAGAKFVDKDEDDLPYITVDTERNVNVITKVLELYNDKNTMQITDYLTGIDDIWTKYEEMLVNGQLFTTVGSLRSYCRTMEDDYGVLPLPKFDETQDAYYHTSTAANAPVMSIPITCSEPEKTAFICEVLSYESYYELMPIFYENYLNTKMLRDTESVDMLKIIHDSLCFELGIMYLYSDLVAPVSFKLMASGSNDVASSIASVLKPAETMLDEIVASISK